MVRAVRRFATMDAAGVIRVEVPNALLQQPYKIKALVCIREGEVFKTYREIHIPVKARPQPADYTITDDDDIYSFLALETLVYESVAEVKASNAAAAAAAAQAVTTANAAAATANGIAGTANAANAAAQAANTAAQEAKTKSEEAVAAVSDASKLTAGTLATDRLPVVPVDKGGTGAANGAEGLANLLAAGAMVLSSHQFGDELPAPAFPAGFSLRR
jgi:hypothetical protein